MPYILDGVNIRAPFEFTEGNNTQMAAHRTLDGGVSRDYFGSNKKNWSLSYRNTKKADHDVIRAIYESYLSTGQTKTWAVSETNYTISQTNVHIDLDERGFNIRGEDYLSDFDILLSEA